ncbi:MAG: glycosyltransferase [Desulfobacteraceae bacterium]|nr:glycosyltransferase [Desulfobacteraceae bacterium]
MQFKILSDDQPVLILSYPLKVIYIDRFWEPLLNCFTSYDYLFLDHIAQTCPEISIRQIEFFLNDLTRKGFFKLRGFSFMEDDDLPFVSIIIPVRNRPKDISACLTSLEQLDYPKQKKEVIVVDDASDDNTSETVRNFPEAELIALTENSQASFCRNRAARTAKGDLLAFIDSDCTADPSWLRELVPAFQDETLGAMGGLVDSYYNKNNLDQYETAKSALKIGSGLSQTQEQSGFLLFPAL